MCIHLALCIRHDNVTDVHSFGAAFCFVTINTKKGHLIHFDLDLRSIRSFRIDMIAMKVSNFINSFHSML